jgi:CIC family chloride channel protein
VTSEAPDRSEQAQLLVWALCAGTLGGSAALALRAAADRLVALAWPGSNLVHAVAAAPLAQRLAIPVGGALLAALVLRLGERLSGSARGWDILEAVLLRDGVLHLRPVLARAFSSLLTVASAGAVGREGSLVLVSAAVASQLGQWRGLATRHLRLLTGCGVAAGLAAAYNTPLGAALFTMEVVFGSFAFEIFGPLVFASGVATLLTRAAFGDAPIFGTPHLALGNPSEVAAHVLLGALGGLLAAALLHSLRGFARLFRNSGLPLSVTLPLSGLALGVATLGYPEVVGNGREAIVDMFGHAWPVSYMVALLALRLVITPMAVGAGAVGGVFTPTLLMGALLGGTYGRLVTLLLPGTDPRAFALVGMGCVLAGTTHAPLTSVVMLFEMTLDYDLVLPLLLASAVSTLVARRLAGESVYTEALRRKGEREVGSGAVGILTVRDVMREEQLLVPPDLPLPQVLDTLVAARRNHAYVVDAQGGFVGAVNLHDVHRALREAQLREAVLARDVAVVRFEAALPDERLDQVLERFWRLEAERLPVLADLQSRRLLGTVSKRDILGVSSLGLLARPSGVAAGHRRVAEVDVPGDVIGLSLEEARFGERHDVSLLMIRRAGSGFVLPDARTRFEPLDRLIVFGPAEAVAALGAPGS